ncbi:MAG: M15 family metallopeptidase [Melioribacteraceae bacterium]
MKIKFVISFLFYSIIFSQNDTSLVLLKNIDSTIVTDVRYATTNNFMGKVLYTSDKVMIRKIVADSLANANNYFKKNFNLRIKIFDGYRPLSVQKLMWEVMPDDRYVANPVKGSRHNRGAAIDITLVDSLGNQLEMGTEYDNFTKKAHPNYKFLPKKVRANRKLLSNVIKKFGFHPITSEWWHFDFQGWRRFSILDIIFE